MSSAAELEAKISLRILRRLEMIEGTLPPEAERLEHGRHHAHPNAPVGYYEWKGENIVMYGTVDNEHGKKEIRILDLATKKDLDDAKKAQIIQPAETTAASSGSPH